MINHDRLYAIQSHVFCKEKGYFRPYTCHEYVIHQKLKPPKLKVCRLANNVSLSSPRKESNVITLKSRYTNMYIPSDFFNASFSWTDAFPMHRPLGLGQQCSFHVMHKEVDPIEKYDVVLEPPDADHFYSAKVRHFFLSRASQLWTFLLKD